MKAEELMIGDWVQVDYRDKAVQVTGVLDKAIYANVVSPLSEDEFKPIPLTPKILEKNGFEKLDFSHFQIGDRRLVLDADGRWDGPLSWHWVVTEMDTNAKGQPVVLDYYVATINYVHELQHALRLCGIEHEIKL